VSDSRDDLELVRRIRKQEPDAWQDLIARYERRLLSFVEPRLGDRSAAEDVVQETFLGFLRALPNYDTATPLESFLFAIAAHKLKDVLRHRGRKPFLSIFARNDDDAKSVEPAGRGRRASALARSAEQRRTEEQLLSRTLQELVQSWYSRGEFERLACIELLFVLGWPNKDVARELDISEQAVANHKQFVVQKLKAAAGKMPEVDLRRLGIE
jgi:RNA polymerase sigma-70 factor (ECF subfamily)